MAETQLTAEAVVDGPVPREVALSPDGRWVVYAVGAGSRVGDHPVGDLWVAPVEGDGIPRRLTSGDSSWVYFLSDRGGRGTAQVHRVDPAGGVVHAVTAWDGGVSGHRPLADPELVAFVAADEPSTEDRRRSGARRGA